MAVFEKKGILEPNKGAKYRANLILTDKGRELARQINRRAGLALQQAGNGLSEEMRENMYRSLDIIAANMRVISESGLEDSPDGL